MSKIITTLNNLNGRKMGFGPISEVDIKCAEVELGLSFAQEYIEFVSYIGALAYLGNEITGVVPVCHLNVLDETKHLRDIDSAFPRQMYVVSNLHIDGIRIVQNCRGEIFEYHPKQLLVKIKDSLADYLLSL